MISQPQHIKGSEFVGIFDRISPNKIIPDLLIIYSIIQNNKMKVNPAATLKCSITSL